MTGIDPRLRTALTRQFARRDAALARGATRVGWKLGAGGTERIGPGPVVGYLLSDTSLDDGSSFHVDTEARLHVDAEVAVSS